MKWRVSVTLKNTNHRNSRPTPSRAAAQALLDLLDHNDGERASLQAWKTDHTVVAQDGRRIGPIRTTWHTMNVRFLNHRPKESNL
jgi:hypothetical protein